MTNQNPTVWSTLQALLTAYTEYDESAAARIPAILTELKHDADLGSLATTGLQYWNGCTAAEASGHKRLFDYRLRQFDKALETMQELVYADAPRFGGPEGMVA